MKTLIDIEDRRLWAKVKYFATVRDLSLNSAVKLLIKNGLEKSKLSVQDKYVGDGPTNVSI
jgi:hypothetical protein